MPRVTRQTAASAGKAVPSTAAAPSSRPARPPRAKLTARAKARPHTYTVRCTAENCCGKDFSRNKMKDARVAMMKHLYRYGLHSIKRAEEGYKEIKEEEEEDARGPGGKRRQKIKFDDEHLKAYKKELEKGDYDHESEERRKADRDRKAVERRLNNAGMRGRTMPSKSAPMRGRAMPTSKNAPMENIKEENSTPFDRVALFLSSYRHESSSYKGFDRRLIQKNLELVSAQPTKTTFELTVSERFTDIDGSLHTGAASLILNVCTTITMIAGAKSPGITRSLNVTYIRPILAMEGSRLIIESEVVAAEERETVILRGIIKDKESGEVICTAEHLKYFTM